MTPPVPSHFAPFPSPAPRSVPSPAISGFNPRLPQQAANSPYVGTPAGKKPLENHGSQTTPIASQTTPAGSHTAASSHSIQATMSGHLSAPSNFGGLGGLAGSSPAMLNFDSPAALGLTLGELDGGVGMGITMSALGLSMGGRGDDDDRRRRLEEVLDILRKRPGRVSEEGVERLASRCGLEVSWSILADERKLGIAGLTTFLADVYFQGNAVERVELEFASEFETVTKYASKAAGILHRDLRPSANSTSAYVSLRRFADNLERLATMDKLSTADVNCFDAVGGVYASLKKLYELENKMAADVLDSRVSNLRARAERDVICKRSGKPEMHAGDRVGLALKYWMQQRNVFQAATGHTPITSPTAHGTKMDIDAGEAALKSEEPSPFSVIIECESSPAELYPPIRISNDWLSLETGRPSNEASAQGLSPSTGQSPRPAFEWRDPPPTYQASPEAVHENVMAIDGSASRGKLPNVRFIARLEPPVVLPLNVAEHICNSVGTSTNPEMLKPTTFDGLVLPRGPRGNVDGAASLPCSGNREVKRRKVVWVKDGSGAVQERIHDNSLFVAKAEYARELVELPFEHPRQVIAILPLLRQHTFLARLLQSSFAPGDGTETAASVHDGLARANENGEPNGLHQKGPFGTEGTEKDLTTFMADEQSGDEALLIDISLVVVPSPHLTVLFPLLSGVVASITLAILPNADVTILGQNLVPQPHTSSPHVTNGVGGEGTEEGLTQAGDEMEKYRKRIEALAKALMTCEDLNVWAEWIRRKFG